VINRFLILVHTILSKMFQHVFLQVHLRDESAEDFENENIPELLYLDISLQVGKTVYHRYFINHFNDKEDLFENARVGSTVINDCEFEINEDSVIVTGFTVK
jgi:hypothetical protein